MRIKVLLIVAKLGNNLQYHPHFWYPLQIQGSSGPPLLTQNATLGVPKTTLDFNNLPEGHIDLTESCGTHSYSLFQWKDIG